MSDKKFIPEIYRYCDRWCENCSFRDRCKIYTPTDHQKDWVEVDADEQIRKITDAFEKTMNTLKTIADASGMDWNQLVEDAKEVKLPTLILPEEHKELIALAEKYRRQVGEWLADYSEAIDATACAFIKKIELGIHNGKRYNAQFEDTLHLINWYHALIESKIRLAIGGLHDDLSEEGEDEIQNYANGCAKIAMIFIEKSTRGWQQLISLMPEQTDSILDQLTLLNRLKKSIHKNFPAHEAFIRPGFDTFII